MGDSRGDVRDRVAALEHDRQAWIDGHFDPAGPGLVQADDMTIFGPFGSDLGCHGPELVARQRRASAQFAGGTSRCELSKAVVFRRDGDRWLRLHRHADPLIRPRPLPETLALLDE